MSKKGIGAMMIFMGVGGFILPMLGLQFRLLNIFGSGQYLIAGALAVIGLILMLMRD